jgi:hypothetical protein
MLHDYLPSYKTLDRNQLTNFFNYSRNSKLLKGAIDPNKN